MKQQKQQHVQASNNAPKRHMTLKNSREPEAVPCHLEVQCDIQICRINVQIHLDKVTGNMRSFALCTRLSFIHDLRSSQFFSPDCVALLLNQDMDVNPHAVSMHKQCSIAFAAALSASDAAAAASSHS